MSFDPPKLADKGSSNRLKYKSQPGSGANSPSVGRSSPRRFGDDAKSVGRMKKKIGDQDTKIKSLERDIQALNAKLHKYENAAKGKSKKVAKEQEMRLQANQDRYSLQQKLTKMQKAIQARLKLLNIDFANCKDLSEALDAAFAAIQKLSAQLEERDARLNEMESEKTQMQKEGQQFQSEIEKLKKTIKKQKDTIAQKDNQMSESKQELKEADSKANEWENEKESLQTELERLQNELDAEKKDKADKFDEYAEKQQNLMEKLSNVEKENESLSSQLSNQSAANQKLTSQNDELQKKLDDLQNQLAAALADAQTKGEALAKLEQDSEHQLSDLKKELRSQQQENEKMEREQKKLKSQVRDMEDTMAIQDEEIASYKSKFESQKEATQQIQSEMSSKDKELSLQLENTRQEKSQLAIISKKLKKQLEERDEELAKLKQLYNSAKTQLDEILNKPTENKEVQTDITGEWFNKNQMTLGRINDIETRNQELVEEAQKHRDRLAAVVDENKSLLDEIDFLIKQAAQFRPDGGNHTGQVVALASSPTDYIVATSATDKTVRLWRIDLNAEKASKAVTPYAAARMEGTPLSLAFARDGQYLVAGVAYKNGPEGALLVWNMSKGDGDVEILFRSRETLRFGRAHCVCWSDNNQYIFSGDTTGTIWVWDLVNNVQLAQINAHKDVVHDVAVSRGMLFSCSLDQTLCGFDINLAAKVPIKQDKLHLHQPKILKGFLLDKNDRYPYQRVMPSDDLKYVVAGARKLFCFTYDEEKQSVGKGPRMTDTDADFCKSVKVKNGLVAICRQGTPRAKVFDLLTGKEVKKVGYKTPCAFVDFVWDMRHCVVMCQEFKQKKAQPPTMKLWKFKE